MLDEPIGSGTWTRVNVGEAYPGVPTPLTWSWAGPAGDIGLTASWARIGVFPPAPQGRWHDPALRSIGISSGRVVLNLDRFRGIGDRIPFNSGDKVEQTLFSSDEVESSGRPVRSRYPVVAVKAPVALVRARRELLRSLPITEQWWHDSIRAIDAGPEPATGLLRESSDRYGRLVAIQGLSSMIGQGMFEILVNICRRYGIGQLAGLLATATDHTAATRTVEDLWQLSRGQLDETTFLHRHGYQSPIQGELAVPSWRVDPTPIRALARTYAERGADGSAAATQARRLGDRDTAERLLLAQAPRALRPAVTRLLRVVRAVVPLREVARSQFLQTYDVARAAADRIGRDLVDRGVLDDPTDAYFLTVDELIGAGTDPATIAARRTRRSFYEAHEIPVRFTCRPELLPIVAGTPPSVLHGIGASGGVAEGPARLVTDDVDELREGEILVAETTNPSHASYFLVAAGVVVDIGGLLSHGAVVAREMGIPCVINTRTACRTIRTGDLIRVDGTAGTVDVLKTG